MRIRDCMTEHPYSIGKEQALSKAQEMMYEHEIRHLPVLHGGELVGVISQRDVYLMKTYAEDESLTVEDAMTQEVYCTVPDASLNSVAGHMAERKLGSAVVMDDIEGVIGIFTVTDALKVLATSNHQ